MKVEFLTKTALFEGVAEADIAAMLDCLSAEERACRKDEVLAAEGDAAGKIGIVLSGSVLVKKVDYFGNETVITHIGPGGIFGEAFACAQIKTYPVTVICAQDGQILWMDYRRIIQTCNNACTFHSQLIFNMLKIVAGRNLVLSTRIDTLSRRTTREKILAYLTDMAQKTHSPHVEIPFNRQAFADFLCVDRSALSRELSKMRDEGIITFYKNQFTLL